jgi:hypothetical protein
LNRLNGFQIQHFPPRMLSGKAVRQRSNIVRLVDGAQLRGAQYREECRQ